VIDPVSRWLWQGAGGRGPIVLMYHSITPGSAVPEWRWAVAFDRFAAQLDLLRQGGWTAVCFRDLVDDKPLPPRTVAITFDDGYADNEPAFRALAERNMHATWFIVSRDIGRVSGWTGPGAKPRPMLSADLLREMAATGMEIGAHTRSHCRLTEADECRLHEEIVGCKSELASVMGFDIDCFAYPYGVHDDRVVQAVRNAGYKAACVTRSGWARSDPDPMRVRRLAVYNTDDLACFARKLAFADNEVGWTKVAHYYLKRLGVRLPGGANAISMYL